MPNHQEYNTITGIDIVYATDRLFNGELVAIPTETVYGLAANALNEEAVLKIYEVKQRPQFNPLIIHVDSFEYEKLNSIKCTDSTIVPEDTILRSLRFPCWEMNMVYATTKHNVHYLNCVYEVAETISKVVHQIQMKPL
jgi:hypothetical protein